MAQRPTSVNTRTRHRPAVTAPAQAVAAVPARALELQGAEGTIEVFRSAYGRQTESRERIRVPVYGTNVARVGVKGGITRNLGDYNSARVDVSIEVPCYPVEEDIRAAYVFASEMIDELLPLELEKAVTPSDAS